MVLKSNRLYLIILKVKIGPQDSEKNPVVIRYVLRSPWSI